MFVGLNARGQKASVFEEESAVLENAERRVFEDAFRKLTFYKLKPLLCFCT